MDQFNQNESTFPQRSAVARTGDKKLTYQMEHVFLASEFWSTLVRNSSWHSSDEMFVTVNRADTSDWSWVKKQKQHSHLILRFVLCLLYWDGFKTTRGSSSS